MTIAKKNGHKKRGVVKHASATSRRSGPNRLHEKLIKLFMRPNGATLHDTWNAGFYYPALSALKIAARHGLKVSVVKPKHKGELTRYVASRRGAKPRR